MSHVLRPYTGPIQPGYAVHYVGSGSGFPADFRQAFVRMFAAIHKAEGDQDAAAREDAAIIERHRHNCLVFPTGTLGSA